MLFMMNSTQNKKRAAGDIKPREWRLINA